MVSKIGLMKYFPIIQNLSLRFSQKGVSLYYAVIITSLLLSITFGLTTILVGQIKISKAMGDSAIAFFAADTGIEKILYLEKECNQAGCTTTWSGVCNTNCTGFITDPYSTSSQWDDTSYTATASSTGGGIIFKSKGIYKATQRAIESAR